MFTLHPQLASDTFLIGELSLCRALLMNNRRFPWVILVPRKPELTEIIDLSADDRRLLMDEIAAVSGAMKACFRSDKLNVAALGNQVAQLHVHVIARFKTDSAWPKPVWGGEAEAYASDEADSRINALKDALTLDSW